MGLNIKNAETHRRGRKSAARTGESLTYRGLQSGGGTTKRVKNKGVAEQIKKIGEACSARLKGKRLPDINKVLYDEKGFFK